MLTIPAVLPNIDPAREPGEDYRAVVVHDDGTIISSFGPTPDDAEAAVRRHLDKYEMAAAGSTTT